MPDVIGAMLLALFLFTFLIGAVMIELIQKLRTNIEAALAKLRERSDYDAMKAENIALKNEIVAIKAEVARLNELFDVPVFEPSNH